MKPTKGCYAIRTEDTTIHIEFIIEQLITSFISYRSYFTQSRFLMRFSNFLMRDSSNGAEVAEADDDAAAADGDCNDVDAGAVALLGEIYRHRTCGIVPQAEHSLHNRAQ